MKSKLKKRLLSFVLACIFFTTTASSVVNAQEISPRYNNVESASSIVDISNSGVISITNKFSANNSVFSKAVITTYIERKILGLFWSRVDIEQNDDEWVDTIYNNIYKGTHSHQLVKNGTYRVTVEYVIYGSGGLADNFTKEIEIKY